MKLTLTCHQFEMSAAHHANMNAPSQTRLLVENYVPQDQKLRLAVVTETWPPEVNGVAMTLSRLIQQLAERGHTIQLIRPKQDSSDVGNEKQGWSEMLTKGLPIPRYPQLKLGLPGKKALIQAWTLHRPDLVHVATEGPLGWSALQAAKCLKLPVTSDFRTNFHAYSKHYGMGWLSKPIVAYLRKFHNRTQRTMVPTHELLVQLQTLGFERLDVIARGVDTELFNPGQRSADLRQKWGADKQTVVLLCVARLAVEKNLDLVVSAYHAMQAQGREVKLVFAGDGPYRVELQQKCPDAIFMGMCSQQQLASVYASADVFAFPSLTETFGNVTVEALASGTPVIAFDCAAAGALLQHQANGWLVAVEDEQAFIRTAVEATQDLSTLREMRYGTAASVQNLAWSSIADAAEQVFRRVLLQTR